MLSLYSQHHPELRLPSLFCHFLLILPWSCPALITLTYTLSSLLRTIWFKGKKVSSRFGAQNNIEFLLDTPSRSITLCIYYSRYTSIGSDLCALAKYKNGCPCLQRIKVHPSSFKLTWKQRNLCLQDFWSRPWSDEKSDLTKQRDRQKLFGSQRSVSWKIFFQ